MNTDKGGADIDPSRRYVLIDEEAAAEAAGGRERERETELTTEPGQNHSMWT